MDEPVVRDRKTGEALGDPAGSDPELKTNGRRVANQELACWLVELVAANATDKTPAEQQKLANWLNSLPTGGGAGPDRYWPANFPRPDRSDWR